MYSQQDIDDAINAGAIDRGAAERLRAYVAQSRSTTLVDEEHFRLLTGFNDIFVSLAAIILLFAVGWFGNAIGDSIGIDIDDEISPLGPFAVAAASWALAVYFTGKRRMALPSIILLLSFVSAIFFGAALSFAMVIGPDAIGSDNGGLALVASIVAASGLVAAVAAWFHWKAFRVPITIAAGAAAVTAILGGLMAAALAQLNLAPGEITNIVLAFFLALGIAVFLYAMKWDASDPERITRRSDVAFWLHLLAAPMIANSVFILTGIISSDAPLAGALSVVAIYIVFGLVALAVDRRALLVSALVYVLIALNVVFERFGAVNINLALTALVLGSALLMLSALWHKARIHVVSRLPAGLRARLPAIHATGEDVFSEDAAISEDASVSEDLSPRPTA